ncbi:MAG: tetratricopeptide repeat protein [Verrucomicrobiota bacterium]
MNLPTATLLAAALFTAFTTSVLTAQDSSSGAVDIQQMDIAPGDAAPPPTPEGGLTIDTGVKAPQPSTSTPAPTAPDGQSAPNFELPDSTAHLTPEQQEKLRALLTEASQFVQGIRVQEAFERIYEIQQMAPDLAIGYNLEGAAWTKAKDFDRARAAFEKCLALEPESMEARFNLAELDFVAKEYESSLGKFSALIEDEPRFPARTRNLILYKIYLCNLMLENTEAAEEMLAEFNYMSDTPEYWYGNAAKHFKAGDEDEARSWLRSASRIYSRMMQDLFVDSLVELHWVETL